MRPILLFVAAVVLPIVWGWGVNLMLTWLWPMSASSSPAHNSEQHQLDPFTDYQI